MSHEHQLDDEPGPWIGFVPATESVRREPDAAEVVRDAMDEARPARPAPLPPAPPATERVDDQQDLRDVDEDGRPVTGALELATLHARAAGTEPDDDVLDDADLDVLLADVPDELDDAETDLAMAALGEEPAGTPPPPTVAAEDDLGAFDLEDLAAVMGLDAATPATPGTATAGDAGNDDLVAALASAAGSDDAPPDDVSSEPTSAAPEPIAGGRSDDDFMAALLADELGEAPAATGDDAPSWHDADDDEPPAFSTAELDDATDATAAFDATARPAEPGTASTWGGAVHHDGDEVLEPEAVVLTVGGPGDGHEVIPPPPAPSLVDELGDGLARLDVGEVGDDDALLDALVEELDHDPIAEAVARRAAVPPPPSDEDADDRGDVADRLATLGLGDDDLDLSPVAHHEPVPSRAGAGDEPAGLSDLADVPPPPAPPAVAATDPVALPPVDLASFTARAGRGRRGLLGRLRR